MNARGAARRIDPEVIRRQAETPTTPGQGELSAVADDYVAAFADDPVLGWLLRDDAGRPYALRDFFNLIVQVTRSQKAEIQRPACGGAAALWVRSEHLDGLGFADEARIVLTLLGACGLARVPRALAVREAMDAHHPTDRPHDYLYFLGVRPEYQGLGVGSRLLRARTERLDAERRPAFLETGNERTLSLYRSHGFEVIDQYRPRGDGPQMWALWREPR
ncbi:MAG: GNAT family N-acetyltransferase [Phenylobacterium sp.]|uniref:GNAT family N-acetyltransferase n=1 Tax=Phenylobacterium sp. TaxID=1871053 RepID=UPI0025E424BA|nr:GNAT family N-acetyltransferase [Phenylobacterium sp.]MBI1198873.1 GNAT family N-acetyltransferase [Phenylobacterium sp.]